MSRSLISLCAVGLLTLACGGGGAGGGGGGGGGNPPVDNPKPKPKPKPKCTTWHEVKLPLDDTTSVPTCTDASVKIEHEGQNGGKLRWDYVDLFKAQGYQLGDPKGNALVVRRNTDAVHIKADDDTVHLVWKGGP